MTKHEGALRSLATQLALSIDSDLPRTLVEAHAYAALSALLEGLQIRFVCGVSGAMPYDVKVKYTAELD